MVTKAQQSGLTQAVIYTRVSTEDQAVEGTSLAAQLAECRRYVAGHGWIIDSEHSDVMSGRKDARPAYQAVLERVRQLRASGRNVVVVVSALDRFGRRLLERVRAREELASLGVATHSVREGGEVGDMAAGFLAVMAEEESKRLSMRMRHTWIELNHKGWWKVATDRIPWGYRTRPATPQERAAGAPNAVLEPDPMQAPAVREVFERIARGERVLPTVRWIGSLPADVRGGRQGNHRTVQLMLRRPVYVGRLEPDGPQGKWEPIVDEETWRAVQERLDAHQRVPRQGSGNYLLTGFAWCPECGSRMQGDRLPGRKAAVTRYRCCGGRRGGTARSCTVTADAKSIDALVLDRVGGVLNAVAGSVRLQAALEREWSKLTAPAADPDDVTRRRLERQVAKSRERVNAATRKFVDGDISKEAYDGLIAEEQRAIGAAEAELKRLNDLAAQTKRTTLPAWSEVRRVVGDCSTALQSGDMQRQRDVLALLVSHVVPRRNGRMNYAASIDWTPLGKALEGAVSALAERT